MSERARHWDDVYSRKAETDVSWFEATPERSLALIEHAGISRSAPIIDIGGGLSHLAESLIDAGYTDVSVLDISAEAIRKLLASRPGVAINGIVSDVTAWKPIRRYALWHDRAVLHFLTEEKDRAAYRAALLSALMPRGHVIIATFALDGPEKCSGLPVRRYGRAELESFLGAEFTPVEDLAFEHVTPGGSVQRFHAGRFQRRG